MQETKKKVFVLATPQKPKVVKGELVGLERSKANLIPSGQPGNEEMGRKGWWETNPEKLGKLEEAFVMGNTDEDACAYAEISRDQLYYYCSEVNPNFQLRKEQLKAMPIMRMNNIIVNEALGYTREETDEKGNVIKKIIPANSDTAKWYLERKRKKDFSLRTELTGADGKDLVDPTPEQKKKLDLFLNGKPIHETNTTIPDSAAISPTPAIPEGRTQNDDQGNGQRPPVFES